MMKKLKQRNKTSNGVVPAAAVNPCCLTGCRTNPIIVGLSRSCKRSSQGASSRSRLTRIDVVCPKRLPHNCRPVANETNALGVGPCRSQYASSFGRMRRISKGNGGSHSRMVSSSVTPLTVGTSARSSAAPESFTTDARRSATVFSLTFPSMFSGSK